MMKMESNVKKMEERLKRWDAKLEALLAKIEQRKQIDMIKAKRAQVKFDQ
jgi:hypothetical protein